MPSSATLGSLTTRIQNTLMDAGAAVFSTESLSEGLAQALEEYSRTRPLRAFGNLTLGANTREVSLSTLTGLEAVERVWYPYIAADTTAEPTYIDFDVYDNGGALTLVLTGASSPGAPDVARVFYVKLHSLSGLNGASSTTFDARDEGLLVFGACGFACLSRSVDLNETAANQSVSTPNYAGLAELYLGLFRDGLQADERQLTGITTRFDWSGV